LGIGLNFKAQAFNPRLRRRLQSIQPRAASKQTRSGSVRTRKPSSAKEAGRLPVQRKPHCRAQDQ
jgi:hypothetical protein